MYCPECGTDNGSNTSRCIACNAELPPLRSVSDDVIYCRRCGSKNDAHASRCTACDAVLREEATEEATEETSLTGDASVPDPTPPLKDLLVPSILVALFCCLPLGIPAIVFAARARSKSAAGDQEGAREASERASNWMWTALIFGVLAIMAFVVLRFMGTDQRF